MEIKFFKPRCKILQNYIEGYYFLSQNPTEEPISYLTFPNNFSILSIYEKIEITFLENKVILTENHNYNFSSDLICNFKKPIHLNYIGAINEITFYFKPLGLNSFLPKNLSTYTNDFFSNFIPFDDYELVMKEILNEKNQEIQCMMIEKYWLSKFIGFEHLFLDKVISDLKTKEKEYTIAELALKHNITRQHLSKHFEMHLCKTPSEFKKIQRFREVLKSQINKTTKENFTSLSCEMLFYDQSHLIKDFKSLTGLTPKNFFKNITSQENGEINWLFVH